MSDATSNTQDDVMNAELHDRPQAATPAALSLNDMPGEIIEEIVKLLLCDGEHSDRHRTRYGFCRTDYDTFPYTLLQTPEGRDVLAPASCSRWMRLILLARRLLAGISIHPCERDLDIINGWDENVRAHVKMLIITPSPRHDTEPDLPISFDAFIRPFPNLVDVAIYWTPFSDGDPRLQTVANAPTSTIVSHGEAPRHSAYVQDLTIEIRDNPDHIVTDRSKIEQLGHLMRQLPFTEIMFFELSLGKFDDMHSARGAYSWFMMNTALQNRHFPHLEVLHLNLGDFAMNGGLIGVDFGVNWVIQTSSGHLNIVAEQEVSAPGLTYDELGYEEVTQYELFTSGEDIHSECPDPTVEESLVEREEEGNPEEEEVDSNDGAWEAENEIRHE